MIEFFRDVLDGPIYIVTTILSIIFIMAIIGFLMERKKLEKEAKAKIAVVETPSSVTPITPVTIEKEVSTSIPLNGQQIVQNDQIPNSNLENQTINSYSQVKPPVIIFEDPDQKKQ